MSNIANQEAWFDMKKVLVIVGPTGVGKTKLSIELAKHYGAEIINADSTQVFKGLDIATAKVTEDEKEGIVHHLFDIREMDEDYTVFDYQTDCRRAIDELLSRNVCPILVGGTGLYIRSCLYDYVFEDLDNSNQHEELSDEQLYERLLKLDPDTDIHPNNRVRVVKALNYCITNNKPYSQKEKTDTLLYDCIIVGLTTEREVLYERINKRVDLMLDNGLEEEARAIYLSGVRSKAVMTPIGYKELFDYFDGNVTKEEAVDLIKLRSRRYAKRQYTWFNNQMKVEWFDTNFADFGQTVEEVIKYIDSSIKNRN